MEPTLIHTENELKFLINNMSEENLKKYQKHDIKQSYLDIKNENVKNLINKNFACQVDFNYSEARMRVIDNKYCFLTLKSNETNQRKEMEKEIAIPLSRQFLPYVTKSLAKTRYLIKKANDMTVEIDFYKDRDLCTIEIEYNDKLYAENNIKDYVSNNFEYKYNIKDITHDKNYKNVNLAKWKVWEKSFAFWLILY